MPNEQQELERAFYPDERLKVLASHSGGTLVYALHGEADRSSAGALLGIMNQLEEEWPPASRVILDCRRLKYCDGGFLDFLWHSKRLFREKNKEFHLKPSPALARLLTITD